MMLAIAGDNTPTVKLYKWIAYVIFDWPFLNRSMDSGRFRHLN